MNLNSPKEKIKTVAIIVAAGNGTRMLSVTKGGAKELVAVQGNIPSIGYSILEALNNGITDIVIVSNRTKRDLESWLTGADRGANGSDIASLKEILQMAGMKPEDVNIDIVHQEIALGLGHAVLTAKRSPLLRDHDGNVYVLLPDEVFLDRNNPIIENIGKLQFVQTMLSSLHSVILTMQVQLEDQGRYGIAELDERGMVDFFIEKPTREHGIKSNEAIAGRYFLSMELFDHLEQALETLIVSLREAARSHKVMDISNIDVEVGSTRVKIETGHVTFNELLAETFVSMAKGEVILSDEAVIAANILKQVLKIEINGKAIGELQLTDEIQHMLDAGEDVGIVSLPNDALRLDIGTAEGYDTAQHEIDALAGITVPEPGVRTLND